MLTFYKKNIVLRFQIMEKESISNKPRSPNYIKKRSSIFIKNRFSSLLKNKIKEVQIKIKGVV